MERIIGGGNPPIHGKTAHKIARWVAAGCPTPRQDGQGGQDQQPGKFRPITQHHLDTLDRAVKITGSQVKASHALGISTGTMWRIMSRTPGRLASKWSLDRVDRWGEAHPAESSPDRMGAATMLAFIRCLTAHLDVAEKTAA